MSKINKEISEILASCDVFASLKAEHMHSLADVCLLRHYKNGDIIFKQDTKADGIYVVATGTIRIYRTNPEGKEQILHIFNKGKMFGEVPVFEGANYPATASADNKASAVYIPAIKFLDISEEIPEILLEMLAELSKRLRYFVHLVDDLSLKEVSARVAKFLLDLSIKQKSSKIELNMTKAVLASRLGTIAETLSRTLKKMQTKDIIHVNAKYISIIDRETLIALASGEKL